MSRGAGRSVLAAGGIIAAVFAMIAADLALRSREAFREGEKWMEWSRRPELRKAILDADLSRRESELSRRLASGELSHAAYRRASALARFERDQAEAESSAKYAYVWHRTAAELFDSPVARWSSAARDKAAAARALWRKELEAAGIPDAERMTE